MRERTWTTRRIVLAGMMAALVIVGSWVRFIVPMGGTDTTLHLGNIMCVLSGIVLGPVGGGLASAIGSAIYDIMFFPAYAAESWITFLTKGVLGLVAGLVAWSGARQGLSHRRNMAAAVVGSISYLALYLFKVFAWDGLLVGGLTVEAALIPLPFKLPGSLSNAILAIVFAPILAKAIQKALHVASRRPKAA